VLLREERLLLRAVQRPPLPHPPLQRPQLILAVPPRPDSLQHPQDRPRLEDALLVFLEQWDDLLVPRLRERIRPRPPPAGLLPRRADEILGLEKAKQNGHAVDRRFLRRVERLDQLSRRDQQALLGTIDAFLAKVS
jgi:hypothetical protein